MNCYVLEAAPNAWIVLLWDATLRDEEIALRRLLQTVDEPSGEIRQLGTQIAQGRNSHDLTGSSRQWCPLRYWRDSFWPYIRCAILATVTTSGGNNCLRGLEGADI
jgi:hypothetical protein